MDSAAACDARTPPASSSSVHFDKRLAARGFEIVAQIRKSRRELCGRLVLVAFRNLAQALTEKPQATLSLLTRAPKARAAVQARVRRVARL